MAEQTPDALNVQVSIVPIHQKDGLREFAMAPNVVERPMQGLIVELADTGEGTMIHVEGHGFWLLEGDPVELIAAQLVDLLQKHNPSPLTRS